MNRFSPPSLPSRGWSLAWLGMACLLCPATTLRVAAQTPAPPAASPPAAGVLRPVERAFLDRAAELSQRQIQLAQIAVSQAESSDVRTYAQQVASDNRQISDSVEGLRRRKGASPGEGEAPATVDTFQQLAQKSGADFDRDFVLMAGELHTTALTLFEEVIAEAKDPDVRDLIGSYLPVLRDHQNRAIELRKAFD